MDLQLKVYDSPDQLVLVLNATEEEEKGLSEDTGLKFKSVSHEMAATVRSVFRKCILLPAPNADAEECCVVDRIFTRVVESVRSLRGSFRSTC